MKTSTSSGSPNTKKRTKLASKRRLRGHRRETSGEESYVTKVTGLRPAGLQREATESKYGGKTTRAVYTPNDSNTGTTTYSKPPKSPKAPKATGSGKTGTSSTSSGSRSSTSARDGDTPPNPPAEEKKPWAGYSKYGGRSKYAASGKPGGRRWAKNDLKGKSAKEANALRELARTKRADVKKMSAAEKAKYRAARKYMRGTGLHAHIKADKKKRGKT